MTPTSLLLHYQSMRPALWPIVSGVLKGVAPVLFSHEVQVGGGGRAQQAQAGGAHSTPGLDENTCYGNALPIAEYVARPLKR